MSKINQIFQCDICGNLISVIKSGTGQFSCCGEPMVHLRETTGDPASEKHIPVTEPKGDGVIVNTGNHKHPMVKSHYFGFMEMEADNFLLRQYLKPGDKAEAFFPMKKSKDSKFRSYCLIHGVFEF